MYNIYFHDHFDQLSAVTIMVYQLRSMMAHHSSVNDKRHYICSQTRVLQQNHPRTHRRTKHRCTVEIGCYVDPFTPPTEGWQGRSYRGLEAWYDDML